MAGDIYFSAILLLLFVVGLARPHIALGGAMVVDLLTPQYLSSAFLAGLPLALFAAALLLVSLTINSGKCSIPKKLSPTILLALFMAWITYTTFHAQFQDSAWYKHDYVIKTLFIALFIPFVFNSRRKIDAAVTFIVGSIAYFTIVGCLRTLAGGVEYGQSLILTPGGTSNVAETSTLSMVSVFIIPLVVHLYRHSTLDVSRNVVFRGVLVLVGICSLVTPIGTQARTGLVALAVGMALLMWRGNMRTRLYGLLAAVVIAMSPIVSDRWVTRMNTLTEVETEGSALGRIIVWKWTLDYVKESPVRGGGFMAYQANAGGVLREYGPEDVFILYHDDGGKAFHSIYFEVLGEHGYVGLAIYLALLASIWSMCQRVARRHERHTWEGSLARALQDALLIFMICGNFIGVAFTHWPYYLLGLASCLHTVASREETPTTVGARPNARSAKERSDVRPARPEADQW